MTSLLASIIVAAFLSLTSLLIVLLRVSPLSAPAQALPAFFLSIFFSTSSVGTLLFYVLWFSLRFHAWDRGKLLSIALREGIFLGLLIVLVILFHLLSLFTWWIVLLIVAMFILIELALLS